MWIICELCESSLFIPKLAEVRCELCKMPGNSSKMMQNELSAAGVLVWGWKQLKLLNYNTQNLKQHQTMQLFKETFLAVARNSRVLASLNILNHYAGY